METIETTATPAPKRTAKPRRKPAPRSPKPASEFAGLTVSACAAGCDVKGCVISGKGYCAHPAKGGLQGKDMGDTALLKRLEAAKKVVGKQKIDPNKL